MLVTGDWKKVAMLEKNRNIFKTEKRYMKNLKEFCDSWEKKEKECIK